MKKWQEIKYRELEAYLELRLLLLLLMLGSRKRRGLEERENEIQDTATLMYVHLR